MNLENLGNGAQNPDASAWDMGDAPAFNSEQQDSGIYGDAVYEPASVDTGIYGDAVYEPASVDTGIYGNAVYESAEDIAQRNAERRQRVIMAAFLTASGGHINEQAIIDRDATLPDGAREEVLDRINSGVINQALERDLLHSIQSPMDVENGAQTVLSKLNNKHEYRIAAWLSGVGFDNYENLGADGLKDLYNAYSTPLDFEQTVPQLIEQVRELNGDQKAAQYQAASESLMRKIYGSQADYWEQLKVLNAEAEERKATQSAETQQLYRSEARAERDLSGEWLFGDVAFCQTSKEQVRDRLVSRENIERGLSASEKCQDSIVCQPTSVMFGVFDGAGGMGNGDVASRFAAETMANYGNYYAINSAEDLANVTRMAQQEMARKNIPGMTTAVVTKLLRKADGVYAAYVSLGDSRFYVVHNDGTADLITQDEGIENQIWNSLSSGYGYAGVNQFGEVKLKRGDKIVLCSDGITGDKGSDLMSNDEVASIVLRSANPEDASRNLVAGARKVDDRTALVIGEFN